MKSIFKTNRMTKRLYFTVAVALVAVSASAIVSNVTSDRLYENFSESQTEYVTEETAQAQAEKTDVADERFILNNTEELEETTEEKDEKVEEETLITKSTEEGTEPETEPQTTVESVKASVSFSVPLSGDVIKNFSLSAPQYNSTMGDYRVHTGIDIAGEEGQEVLSAGDGVVSKVYVDRNWGYVIEIDHGTFTGRYCGISQEGAVGIDDKVKKDSVIGILTSIPCEGEDGIHLHFETEKSGVLTSPSEFVKY